MCLSSHSSHMIEGDDKDPEVFGSLCFSLGAWDMTGHVHETAHFYLRNKEKRWRKRRLSYISL